MPYSGNTCMTCGALTDPEYRATHDHRHETEAITASEATQAYRMINDVIGSLLDIRNM